MSYPRLHLPLAELQALFRQQLHVELAGSMPVESVEKVSPTQEILQAVRAGPGSPNRSILMGLWLG